jgi:2',3'-cyclic-nucleotide 2'-phosphodiesterase/3'-nucleotidase
MRKLLSILLALVMLLGLLPGAAFAESSDSVDFVVLSTTDMHGKCWDQNVLTDGTEFNNMLRVSTGVSQYRESFGGNLLLIDNGDLYQGTPVSVVQLGKITSGESDLPPAMALCLGDIGYDVSVLGNHEFNYPWTTMSKAYDYLASRGVPIITANLYYDGIDGVHESGENVFTPYLIKTFELNGVTHKIGVLGFENTDCTRWDVPANYPGIVFAHPDNPQRSMAWEAQRYIPMMRAEGCEFIIVSYHSGTGSASGELVFGQNTEGQVTRLIAECEGIDMVIAGHDHSNSYSNSFLPDKNGDPVLVVNGGGTQLTQSIFTFTEGSDGKLQYTLKESKNLNLSQFGVDETLKAKIQPYADMAVEYVNQPAGTAVGEWDTSHNYFLQQTDTMDLINCAQIDYGSKYMADKYDTEEKKAALYEATGLDHIEVDLSATSAVTTNNYFVKPGEITMKTIVQMYKYDNNVLYLLPLTGQQIKDVLEQNAATRLKATVRGGEVVYSTIGEDFTNPVFGGLNFSYDMYQPEGSRAVIEGFSNGREFALDKTYVVACNSYHLGNPGCGFGAFTTEDSVWNQNDDLAGGNVQEVLLEYIRDMGEISTEPFTWTWKLDYSGDPTAPTELMGDLAAEKTTAEALNAGDRIVLYYNAEGTVVGLDPAEDDRRLSAVETTSFRDYIAFDMSAAVFTVAIADGGSGYFSLQSEKGYLTAGETGNSLGFSQDGASELALWSLVPAEGGYHIMNVGAAYNGNHNQALEWYSGFTTYGVQDNEKYLFSLYKVVETAKWVGELGDEGPYVIYFNDENLCVGDTENSGGLGGVTNTVSGDFLILPAAEHTLIVTAIVDSQGRIDFVTEDGKHLTSQPTGNGLLLTDEPADNNCSLWTLGPVPGGFHVMNVGAAYNGSHNQALEYYGGKFTTYGVKDTGAYLFNFYRLDGAEKPANPFTDVKEGQWYYDAVLWAYYHAPQITSGTGEGKFSPKTTCTRAQIVTYLWHALGDPEPAEGENPFTDVKPKDYYYKAVLWAVQNGITAGTGPDQFSPKDPCTRCQIMTYLWHALGDPEPESTDNPFLDVKEKHYYYKAVLWAVENGITGGTGDGKFSPNKTCSRAETVTFLWKALQS